MPDNNKILKFPYNETPIWNYLENYYKNSKKSEILGEMYIRKHVPEQLQTQVRDTLYNLMRNKDGI